MKNGHHDIERGKNRIAEGAIGPLHVRAFPAQDEKSAEREDIENQHGENQEIEQLAVRAGEAKDRRPDALDDQRRAGSVMAIHFADGFEEQASLAMA